MDQQTLTLTSQLITGSVALVAGLGGASLTAFINRKNTKESLAAARLTAEDQWQKTQEQSHANWLREQKQEAYSQLLATTHAIFEIPDWAAPKEGVDRSLVELQMVYNRVRMVGASSVRLSSTQMVACALKAVDFAGQRRTLEQRKEDGDQDDKALLELMSELLENLNSYHEVVDEFVKEVRKELHSAAPMAPSPETEQD
ncbi:hypothetical protein [Arthrobacter sp. 18067]|uniref:hypothetical protein n=1 Tax=Arthrobacter sp. 18067 TaxID=2681413 RepID=UPI00135A5049|nr:hypothetical protein [Arthrobacter sp. 18067]